MFNNITLEKIVKFVAGLAAFTLLALFLLNFSNLVVYAVIAILFSYMLDPIVNRLQSAGMNRTIAVTLTLTTVAFIIVWISTSFIPIIANQMAALAGQLSMENIRFIANEIETHFRDNFEFLPAGFLQDNVTQLSENLFDTGRITELMANLIGIFTNIFAAVLIIPLATFFFLKDGSKIRRDLLQFVPNKYFETTLSLIDKVETRLGIYFRSVLIQCTFVAILSWLFLSIAGMSNSASVGITIGVANTIPYFGPVIGYLLAIVVSIIETGDFSLVIPCLLAVLLVQILDNGLIQPLIFSKSADMHPVAILFIIMIGAQTAGILGMLIAIPIATTIKITFNQMRWSFNNYYVYRIDSVNQSLQLTPKTFEDPEST